MTMWSPRLPLDDSIKYRAIAQAIADDIANGKLNVGDRLPTQRQLASKLDVTIGTIGRAYSLAEKRGLISLEVGRGSFVKPIPTSNGDHLEADTVIDLGLNLPPAVNDYDAISRTMLELSGRKDLSEMIGYSPVASTLRHRQAAAEWLSGRIPCSQEDVLICCGTQNALVATLSILTKPGDSVLAESLTFPGIKAAAQLLKLKLSPVAIDDDGMIPESLEKVADQGQVLYCNPTNHNPTATTMSPKRREAIAKVAEKKNLKIIEDDVYGKLVENPAPPLAKFISNDVFLISSISKTISVGLRLAFLYYPQQYRNELVTALRSAGFFPPLLLVEIASTWISSGVADEFVLQRRKTAQLRQQIAREIFGSECIRGNMNGNHIWLSLPPSWSHVAIESAARENGVIVYSSSMFAIGNDNIPNAIRISLGAARNESELRVGLTKIARLLDVDDILSPARY